MEMLKIAILLAGLVYCIWADSTCNSDCQSERKWFAICRKQSTCCKFGFDIFFKTIKIYCCGDAEYDPTKMACCGDMTEYDSKTHLCCPERRQVFERPNCTTDGLHINPCDCESYHACEGRVMKNVTCPIAGIFDWNSGQPKCLKSHANVVSVCALAYKYVTLDLEIIDRKPNPGINITVVVPTIPLHDALKTADVPVVTKPGDLQWHTLRCIGGICLTGAESWTITVNGGLIENALDSYVLQPNDYIVFSIVN